MKPNERFLNQPRHFWANVRTIGQVVGYAAGGKVTVPKFEEVKGAYHELKLKHTHLFTDVGKMTELGQTLFDYFAFRAATLNDFVEPRLMNAEQAKEVFEGLLKELKPKRPIPLNKQKGEKKAPAFLTGIVNMIVEANIGAHPCDFDPRTLTTVTAEGMPLRTLARRVDGAFPAVTNPIAIWEIKEYYYTTTFGSRVADGVYETLLDGLELEELHEHERIKVLHYLMIDAHYTWWDCGKSYLCRMLDMLHMGMVDEVLFGREVVERLPGIVGEWRQIIEAKH